MFGFYERPKTTLADALSNLRVERVGASTKFCLSRGALSVVNVLTEISHTFTLCTLLRLHKLPPPSHVHAYTFLSCRSHMLQRTFSLI